MKFERGSKKPKPTSKPDAILCADLHFRPTVPVCRTDDFIVAMWAKLDFILTVSVEHEIPILCAGDVGHKPQWPNWLLAEFIHRVRDHWAVPMIFAVPGQHDLPNHDIDQWKHSGIGVLDRSGVVEMMGTDLKMKPRTIKEGTIFPFCFGTKVGHIKREDYQGPSIAMTHALVTSGEKGDILETIYLEDQYYRGPTLLKDFPEYDLILTGDNHKPFVLEREGRILVNPGSMMRTATDQIDHKPRIYLWYAKERRVEPIYLPIKQGVIDRTHIDLSEEKDERIDAYVARLSEEVEIGLSFEGNLESYFRANRVRKPVQDRVWSALPQ